MQIYGWSFVFDEDFSSVFLNHIYISILHYCCIGQCLVRDKLVSEELFFLASCVNVRAVSSLLPSLTSDFRTGYIGSNGKHKGLLLSFLPIFIAEKVRISALYSMVKLHIEAIVV